VFISKATGNRLIDFHSHLDLYPDPIGLAAEVAKRNTFTLVVTTSPRAWIGTSRAFAGYKNIAVGLGLHPEIADRKADELPELLKLLAKAKFVGEIGLDGSDKYRESLPLQISILESVLDECQRLGGRIISLHSRRAATRVLDVLELNPNAGLPILHWFSGSFEQLERAISLGCWFSVGPAMLTSAKGRANLLRMPRDRLLTETDGPFATRAGRPLMPWDAFDVLGDVSAAWNVSTEEAAQQINRNLCAVLAMED